MGAPDLPVGAAAYLRIDVPAGLSITAYRAGGHSHTSDESWKSVAETSNGVLYSCQESAGCPGKPGTETPGTIPMAISPTPWLRFGFVCTTAPCDAGVSAHSAAERLYGAGVTITDNVAPAVAGSDPPTSVAYGGSFGATVSGSDRTGIRRLELLVDGAVLATSDRSCDWRRVLPCDSPGAQVSATLQTPALTTPGDHTLQLRANRRRRQHQHHTPRTFNRRDPSASGNPNTGARDPNTGAHSHASSGAHSHASSAANSAPPRPSKLRIISVRRTGSVVRVRGSVAADCRSRLTIRITAAGRTRTRADHRATQRPMGCADLRRAAHRQATGTDYGRR